MRHHDDSMLSGPLFLHIIRYTIPIILTSLLQLLFNAADLVVVGQFCGSNSVGAVGATTSITNLLVNFFIGLSIGAGVCVAQGLGRDDEKSVYDAVHTAIPMALTGGVILTIIGVFAAEPLLRLMETPENVLPLSVVYMRIIFCGVTFNVLYNYCAAILRAAGDTKSPLIFLSIAGVINVIFNVIFVTAFNMNVAGVALATIISQGISAFLALAALIKRQDACRLELKGMRFQKGELNRMLRIGLPAGIQSALFAISNVIIQSSINSFGDVLVAGNAAAVNIEGFVYAPLAAFYQTTVNLVGQNVGAGQYARARKTLWICMGCITAVGVVVSGAALHWGEALLEVYIPDSPEAIASGMVRFTYLLMPYFIGGMMDAATGALRGFGESLIPMIIAVMGICGFRILWISTIFQLPEFHTPQWLYISYPISWVITLCCHLTAFLLVYRRHERMVNTNGMPH